MENIIKLNNCFKTYDQINYVLNDVSLEIKCGEMVAIIGDSGSGKSTLLNILATFDTDYEGEYLFKNIDIKQNKNLFKFRNQEIGFIFQNYNLLTNLTVAENIELPLKYSNYKLNKIKFDELANKLKIKCLLNKKIGFLSGGEKQRVAIARSLINDPRLIIADEPTGNLDDANTNNVIEVLTSLKKDNITILLVTHNLEVAKKCDCIYRLDSGRVKEVKKDVKQKS